MKYLVLCLALLSPEAFSAGPDAAPLTTDEQKNLLPGKFVGDWKVTKENKELLYLDEIRDKGDQKVNVKQTEAYDLGMEVFKKCATVASEGRKDEVCANEPTNPECAGVAGSTKNATNCLEYFPGTTDCKTFGTSEFNSSEWMAVGKLFTLKIEDCKEESERYKVAATEKVRLYSSMTEMIGAGNYLQKLADAPTMNGASYNPNSKISGQLANQVEVKSIDWESFASSVEDGASHLGYEEGDILRATFKGESFDSIVSNSPFVKNKLNYVQRAQIEESLADSKMVAQRVMQTYRTKTGAEPVEVAESPAQSGDVQIAANHQAQMPESNETNASGGAVAPGSTAESPKEAKANAGPPAGAPSGSRAMLEAERLEAVARAAALARAENKSYRSPASVMQSKVEDLLDTTLFQRISQTYRRKSSGMRTFDTRSGDMIRSIEKPEIFRSL